LEPQEPGQIPGKGPDDAPRTKKQEPPGDIKSVQEAFDPPWDRQTVITWGFAPQRRSGAASLPRREHGMEYHFKEAEIHSLLLSTLEEIAGRTHGSSRQDHDPGGRPLAMADLISRMASLTGPPAGPAETILRIGALELDLIERTARRAERPIDLRPREFRLLKYMMQRSGQLVTRANLFTDVWHYKFVPQSNLVDVHMGRLRRKVDGPNDVPMIRNVRGAGFVLSATPPCKALRDADSTRI
jgi:DNA-binding winged helix-turn-helix (wHTH) protein